MKIVICQEKVLDSGKILKKYLVSNTIEHYSFMEGI